MYYYTANFFQKHYSKRSITIVSAFLSLLLTIYTIISYSNFKSVNADVLGIQDYAGSVFEGVDLTFGYKYYGQKLLRGVPLLPQHTVVVTASARSAYSGSPYMILLVDGVSVDYKTLEPNLKTYTFTYRASKLDPKSIKIAYLDVEGELNPIANREFVLDSVIVDGVSLDPKAYYRVGTFAVDQNCKGGYFPTNTLQCNGYFDFSNPNPDYVSSSNTLTPPTSFMTGFPDVSNAQVKVRPLILIYNPNVNGRDLISLENFNDPIGISRDYINVVYAASKGYLGYQDPIVEYYSEFTPRKDGWNISANYLSCLRNRSNCPSDLFGTDYNALIDKHRICERVNSGEIGEVWVWGGPYFGMFESAMAGPNPIWINGGTFTRNDCNKEIAIMGFSYERKLAEALHDLGHRIEASVGSAFFAQNVYGDAVTPWDRFVANPKHNPKNLPYGCGEVHYPGNTTTEYGYEDRNTTSTTCSSFESFPDLSAGTSSYSCNNWGCSDEGFMRYWLSHIPVAAGMTQNVWNNWWKYIVDYHGSTFHDTTPPSRPNVSYSQKINPSVFIQCFTALDDVGIARYELTYFPDSYPSYDSISGKEPVVSFPVSSTVDVTVDVVAVDFVGNRSVPLRTKMSPNSLFLPGSGEVQAHTSYAQTDGTVVEVVYRGDEGWTRDIKVENGVYDVCRNAKPWRGPFSVNAGHYAGAGSIQSLAALILPNKDLVHSYWRNGEGYTRLIPIAPDGINHLFKSAITTGPFNESVIPGEGPIQAQAVIALPSGNLIYSFWRNNVGWQLTMKTPATGLPVIKRDAPWTFIPTDRLPGSGDVQAQNAYLPTKNLLITSFWRGGLYWQHQFPVDANGNVIWSQGTPWAGPFTP